MNASASHPIDESRRIGTVIHSSSQSVKINLPKAGEQGRFISYGEAFPRGEVGEYVCFPRGNYVTLGRITLLELPEPNRLEVEPKIKASDRVDPIGYVALLTDVDLSTFDVTGAVSIPPRLGVAAYSVSSLFLQWVLESSARKRDKDHEVRLKIGTVAGGTNTPVLISPERLFGRHCAILGVTGGGKSYTLARLIEECSHYRCKLILIDATGEFANNLDCVKHYSIGNEIDPPAAKADDLTCPHHVLDEQDLFAIFTPSGQSQAPILRDAIRSLKLAQCQNLPNGLVEEGEIKKKKLSKSNYYSSLKTHAAYVENPYSYYDIKKLTRQIQHECIHDTPFNSSEFAWGDVDQKTLSYCLSLVMRINSMVIADIYAPLFNCQNKKSVQQALDEFIVDDNARVMRISLRYLSFAQSIRPVVVNAIGRHLLNHARANRFRECPLVVCLDEAHQFLGKRIGDENNNYELDAFDLIAKEGRKYALTVCMATQRPRDIQEGVLSQIGTMIVHRLTHGADREVVERAARDVEKSVAAFLPTLAPGQAILLGADFPVPIPIQITIPTKLPESKGPDYQKCWNTQTTINANREG